MAYQSGKTYYLVPRFWVSSTTSRENILNKKTKPLALNTKGTGGHYNNRDCNLWTLDYSTDMQWKVEIPAEGGYARILCAGDTSYGLDYYHGKDDNGNCDIYKVAGNENDSKVNFITISAANNYYRIQCYRNNTGNNLYLTAVRNSNGKFDNGCDVRWCALDPKIPMEQTWWLVPVEDVKGGNDDIFLEDGKKPSNLNLLSDCYDSYINPFYPNYKWQCTWFAWGRAREVTGKSIDFGNITSGRNAGKWHSIAKNVIAKDIPAVGDVGIVEWINPTGNAGHVAFLEKYDGTYFWFSQANKTGDNVESVDDGVVSKRTLNQLKSYCSGYTLGKFLIL